MDQIEVAVIGTGWCGGIRAHACAANPLVSAVHIAENRPERLKEVADSIGAKSATTDYRTLLDNKDISAVFVCATPETTHFPMARDSLRAGKHVFVEKPLAISVRAARVIVDGAAARGLVAGVAETQRYSERSRSLRWVLDQLLVGTPQLWVSALEKP